VAVKIPMRFQILPELKGPPKTKGPLHFDEGAAIDALFNPDELSISGSVSYPKQNAAQRDVSESQFGGGERTLSVKLLFDTYDTPDSKKNDVRKVYTSKIVRLSMVEEAKHRPPVCRLRWGGNYFFQGVLERLDQRFTLFMENGTPVRATLTCTFKEWRQNIEDMKQQGLQSADIVKVKVVRRGDTLSAIAAEEYSDPNGWRPIALANGVDDPLRLPVGRAITVPKLPFNPKRSTT
jgi:nucleoid-associated protein YgaU